MASYETKRAEVIAKAWKDPTFKQKLLSNPSEALKECGVNVPSNTKIKVIEDHAGAYTFVLPAAPSNLSKMSDAELTKIAGGPYGLVEGNEGLGRDLG